MPASPEAGVRACKKVIQEARAAANDPGAKAENGFPTKGLGEKQFLLKAMLPGAALFNRTVSVDPSSRGFGFAVLENGRLLVDWGVAVVNDQTEGHLVARFQALVDRYAPRSIAFECVNESRRGARCRQRILTLEEHCQARSIAVIRIKRAQLRMIFGDFSNKHQIAVTIAQKFPELLPILPPQRKPWMTENPRMKVFGAVALGLVAYAIESKWGGVR